MKKSITLSIALCVMASQALSSYAYLPAVSNIPTGEESTLSTYNVGGQSYSRWDTTINSFIVETTTGYSRIEHTANSLVVEYYNDDFLFIKSLVVPKELDYFNGFYESDDNYFVLFSSDNSDESASVESVRVVKFDKEWNRISHASLFDINTVSIHGSVDMALNGNVLHVHTNRIMYTSNDGLNHQANLRISINIDSMNVLSESGEMLATYSGYQSGYVSHSFNQLVATSNDGQVFTANHGDAYPRSIVLFNWPSNVIGNQSSSFALEEYPDYSTALKIVGAVGHNTTKASLDGMVVNSKNVLLSGISVTQEGSGSYSDYDDYNVYVSSTPINNFAEGNTTLNWITNYDGTTYASNTHLIDIGNDYSMVMWEEKSGNETPIFKCTVVDASGKQASDIITHDTARLSSVEPTINSDGNIVWYSTELAKPIFYILDTNSHTISTFNTIDIIEEYLVGASSWATSEIRDAYYAGLLNSLDSVMSNYTGNITREEFCELIINYYNLASGEIKFEKSENPFTDTTNESAIFANQLGIVFGTGDGSFSPEKFISRQEVAVMIYRTLSLFGDLEEIDNDFVFADESQIASWALTEVKYVNALGILMGSADGRVMPVDNLSCEQAVLLVNRMER